MANLALSASGNLKSFPKGHQNEVNFFNKAVEDYF